MNSVKIFFINIQIKSILLVVFIFLWFTLHYLWLLWSRIFIFTCLRSTRNDSSSELKDKWILSIKLLVSILFDEFIGILFLNKINNNCHCIVFSWFNRLHIWSFEESFDIDDFFSFCEFLNKKIVTKMSSRETSETNPVALIA